VLSAGFIRLHFTYCLYTNSCKGPARTSLPLGARAARFTHAQPRRQATFLSRHYSVAGPEPGLLHLSVCLFSLRIIVSVPKTHGPLRACEMNGFYPHIFYAVLL
jgi:hypothetical protein